MRKMIVAASMIVSASGVIASDVIFELSGWAEIPSTYRHPGPVSGQFTAAANGVTPPYAGQPIPGFSGMIPSATPGTFVALPDNGYGAQGNSADFVLGFSEVTPSFKTAGDTTTSRGEVAVHSFTPFSDPQGFLDSSYITGPVYTRPNYYPLPTIQNDFQGPPSSANPPRQKKLYLFDLDEIDQRTGTLKKRLLVNLLHIEDPRDIGGPLPEIADDTFTFPLQSVESVTLVDDFTLLVGRDNNYPGGNGRVPGRPDGTEIVLLDSKVPLRTLRVQPCKDASLGSHKGWSPRDKGNSACR